MKLPEAEIHRLEACLRIEKERFGKSVQRIGINFVVKSGF
jgi:hypothetical protein